MSIDELSAHPGVTMLESDRPGHIRFILQTPKVVNGEFITVPVTITCPGNKGKLNFSRVIITPPTPQYTAETIEEILWAALSVHQAEKKLSSLQEESKSLAALQEESESEYVKNVEAAIEKLIESHPGPKGGEGYSQMIIRLTLEAISNNKNAKRRDTGDAGTKEDSPAPGGE